MITGRSLGHTGDTLDKLEFISGFRTNMDKKEFLNILELIGTTIIGQTLEIALVDKKCRLSEILQLLQKIYRLSWQT
jgi:thymidine phosphorylase